MTTTEPSNIGTKTTQLDFITTTAAELIVKTLESSSALTSADTITPSDTIYTSRADMSSTVRPTNETILTTAETAIVQVSSTAQTVIAIYMGFLVFFGILNNSIVLYLYYRYKNLHNPVNMFLINVSIGDLIVSTLGSPFMFASTIAGHWLFGDGGCTWYAFIVTVAGCEQIVALAAVSMQRCFLVVRPFTARKMTSSWAFLALVITWIYSLTISLPPAFGWNDYVIEGAGTACSVDWASRNPNDTSYIIFMFITILGIPLSIIFGSYALLLYAVKKMGESEAAKSSSTKADKKVTIMIVIMITAFLIAWTPYSAFALYVAAGNADKVTPLMGTVPSLFAKLCTVYNPIIYFLLNKQFKEAFIDWAFCGRNPFEREESDPGQRSTNPQGVNTVSKTVSRAQKTRGGVQRTVEQSCVTEISDIGPVTPLPASRHIVVAPAKLSDCKDTVEEMKEIQSNTGGTSSHVTEITKFNSPPAETSLTKEDAKECKTTLKPPNLKKIQNRATVTPLPGQPTEVDDGPKVDI
ncbi:rhodopsin-like isoform X1 [Amphiura filiformis]